MKASMWENPSEKPGAVSGREHTMDSIRIWETHRVHGLVMLFGNNTTQTHRSSASGLGFHLGDWDSLSSVFAESVYYLVFTCLVLIDNTCDCWYLFGL